AGAVSASASAALADTLAPGVARSNPRAGSTVVGLVAGGVSSSANVGGSHVDLHVNGAKVASDTTAPYGFSWESTAVADGAATLAAYAYDAAGNYKSSTVSVTVANAVPTTEPEPTPETEPTPEPGADEKASDDTTAPVATISNPG